MSAEYTFFYRPVRSRFGRTLATWVMVPCLAVVAIATSPLTVPLHFLLRKAGRQGFVTRGDDGRWAILIGPEGFHRR